MYEHPSLTITAMLQEQEMLNRAVERRRAILERLETRSVPRRRWVDRLRAAFGNGSRSAAGRPEQESAESGSVVAVSEAADVPATVVVSAGARSDAAESGRAVSATASAGASDSEARRALLERAPADAGILVAPAR